MPTPTAADAVSPVAAENTPAIAYCTAGTQAAYPAQKRDIVRPYFGTD